MIIPKLVEVEQMYLVNKYGEKDGYFSKMANVVFSYWPNKYLFCIIGISIVSQTLINLWVVQFVSRDSS